MTLPIDSKIDAIVEASLLATADCSKAKIRLRIRLKSVRSFAFALIAIIVAGCSRQTPENIAAAAASNPKDAAIASTIVKAQERRDRDAPPTPCETDFSVRDVADILTGSPVLNRYAMNAALGEGGCEFGTRDALIDFSLHVKKPASGDNKQVYDVLASLHDPAGAPLPGVGDRALWFDVRDSNVPDMSELDTLSIKGETICVADLHFRKGQAGEKAITPARGEALARKLGALCTKAFAVRGA